MKSHPLFPHRFSNSCRGLRFPFSRRAALALRSRFPGLDGPGPCQSLFFDPPSPRPQTFFGSCSLSRPYCFSFATRKASPFRGTRNFFPFGVPRGGGGGVVFFFFFFSLTVFQSFHSAACSPFSPKSLVNLPSFVGYSLLFFNQKVPLYCFTGQACPLFLPTNFFWPPFPFRLLRNPLLACLPFHPNASNSCLDRIDISSFLFESFLSSFSAYASAARLFFFPPRISPT